MIASWFVGELSNKHLRRLLEWRRGRYNGRSGVAVGKRHRLCRILWHVHQYGLKGLWAGDKHPNSPIGIRSPSGGSKNFEGGGGRQFISPVVIYRKCTQRTVCLLHGKRRLLKKIWDNRGRPPPPPLWIRHWIPLYLNTLIRHMGTIAGCLYVSAGEGLEPVRESVQLSLAYYVSRTSSGLVAGSSRFARILLVPASLRAIPASFVVAMFFHDDHVMLSAPPPLLSIRRQQPVPIEWRQLILQTRVPRSGTAWDTVPGVGPRPNWEAPCLVLVVLYMI